MSKRSCLNRTLIELWLGIFLFDALIYLIGIWLIPVAYKMSCSIGFGIGFLMALAMAYHISFSLNRYLDYPEKKAKGMITMHALLRYVCVAGILYLILISGFANPLACFAALLGLKAGAYLSPLIHSFTVRKYPDPEPPPGEEELGNNDKEVIQ